MQGLLLNRFIRTNKKCKLYYFNCYSANVKAMRPASKRSLYAKKLICKSYLTLRHRPHYKDQKTLAELNLNDEGLLSVTSNKK